jgi:hypothetical protein
MLTDVALKALRPKEKPYKITDRDGMYVLVSTKGSLSFRLDYRLNGRRETVVFGKYDRAGISLARARELCIDAKRAIREGRSPAFEKQRAKRRLLEAKSFGEFGEKWLTAAPMADSTRAMRRTIFERELLPTWRKRLLTEITPDDLRVVVARVGEMDLAKWWNTRGQLSRLGTAAVRRGFPRTHYFAQARSVFAVAAHRCREVFDPPQSATLWHFPEAVEEEFEAHWERWLDEADEWKPFFTELESLKEPELKSAIQSFNLVTDYESELFSRLRRSAEGRAVPLPLPFTGSDQDVALLALGFARGEPTALAVPYARLDNA